MADGVDQVDHGRGRRGIKVAVGGNHPQVDPPGRFHLDVPGVGEQAAQAVGLRRGETVKCWTTITSSATAARRGKASPAPVRPGLSRLPVKVSIVTLMAYPCRGPPARTVSTSICASLPRIRLPQSILSTVRDE